MQSFNARLNSGKSWPRVPAAALSLILVLFMSGCRGQLDEMRMRIDQSEQGSLTAQVSANVTDEEVNDDVIMNGGTYRELNEIGQEMVRCNIRHVIYGRQRTVFLDLRSAFTDIDDLNSMLRCAVVNAREPRVEFERHDGFLWNRFIFRFAISQDRRPCPAEEDCLGSDFPRVILLTVPGKVHAINNGSRLLGFNLAYHQVDDDTVRVEIAPAADYRAQNLRHFANRRGPEELDEVKLEVVSRVANFNLTTILSVIGMIFGSGLLIQASRWLLFRPRSKPST